MCDCATMLEQTKVATKKRDGLSLKGDDFIIDWLIIMKLLI